MPLAPESFSLQTAHGPARVVASASQLDPTLWLRTFSGEWLDARYYELVEETAGDRFTFRYAVLTQASTGQIDIQPFFLVDQDLAAGLSPRLRPLLAWLPGWIARKLDSKLIVAGCATTEGRLGCREPWALEALDELLRAYARASRSRVILFKEFASEEREPLRELIRRGYRRVPSMPAARIELDFHSFQEYVQHRLGKSVRASLRRKFRQSPMAHSLTLEVTRDITPHLARIHRLYLQTYERSPYKFECLTADYFRLLGLRLPERTRYFLWWHEGNFVAFALCIVHEGVLHYMNVGLDYSVALDTSLYFLVWRDLVNWALEAKLHAIETGPLNYEVKLRLGFRLAPRDLYTRHVSPALNPLYQCALGWLQPTRYDPFIWKFPNAGEL